MEAFNVNLCVISERGVGRHGEGGMEGGMEVVVIAGKANEWCRGRKTMVVRAAERRDKILRKVKRLRGVVCERGGGGGTGRVEAH